MIASTAVVMTIIRHRGQAAWQRGDQPLDACVIEPCGALVERAGREQEARAFVANDVWDATSARSETDAFGRTLYDKTADADRKVVQALGAVAARLQRPRAQVALAWLLHQPGISAPIVGASKLAQLDDAVAALSLELAPEDIAELQAPYVPHAVVGFS